MAKTDLFAINYNELANIKDFLVSSKNLFMFSLLQKMSKDWENAEFPYNPILLRGSTSSGKSHLLEAIANEYHKKFPQKSIALGSTYGLTELLQKPNENKKRIVELEKAEALFLDDIHQLSPYPEVQERLLPVLDILLKNKKIVCCSLTTAHNIDEIPLILPFISRLSAGIVLTIHSPDLDVRMRYTSTLFEKNNVQSTKALHLTLARSAQDIRHLKGIIHKTQAFIQLTKTIPNDDELASLLENAGNISHLSPEVIIAQTAAFFGFQSKEICGPKRNSQLVQARQISMYLCRKLAGLSYPKIALAHGGKDHTTVIHACHKIENSKDLIPTLTKLMKQIENSE